MLRNTTVEQIPRYTGAVEDSVPCNLSTCDAALTFGLGGKSGAFICISVSEVVMFYTGNLYFADRTEAC